MYKEKVFKTLRFKEEHDHGSYESFETDNDVVQHKEVKMDTIFREQPSIRHGVSLTGRYNTLGTCPRVETRFAGKVGHNPPTSYSRRGTVMLR